MSTEKKCFRCLRVLHMSFLDFIVLFLKCKTVEPDIIKYNLKYNVARYNKI